MFTQENKSTNETSTKKIPNKLNDNTAFEKYARLIKTKTYPEPTEPLATDVVLGGSLSDTTPVIQNKEEDEKTLQGKGNIQLSAENKKELLSQPNNTGLPDNLKNGIENLSGYNMDDVKVHYNSAKPSQLQALAFTQGTDIHVTPGKEQHLPHEAWHVVQQKQGRVQPTRQMKGSVAVNDDKGLEQEADVMGKKALQLQKNNREERLTVPATQRQSSHGTISQLLSDEERYAMNAKANDAALMVIYENYVKKGLKSDAGAIYKLLTKTEDPEYTKDKPSADLSDAFFKESKKYSINPQKKPSKDSAAEFLKGNYFHVHNKAADENLRHKGKDRRIIVNVKTQTDAMMLSVLLRDKLFSNDTYKTHISEFKVYLSQTQKDAMKFDKMVIYYTLMDGSSSANEDQVGNFIATTVQESIEQAKIKVEDKFAPFYSHLGGGMAWGDEANDITGPSVQKRGSFSTERVNCICRAIDKSKPADSFETFKAKVSEEFTGRGIDPAKPHRNL